jgi:hypothetical protein
MEQRNNGNYSIVVLVSQSISEKVGIGVAGLLTFLNHPRRRVKSRVRIAKRVQEGATNQIVKELSFGFAKDDATH